jgi:hypothetical protein
MSVVQLINKLGIILITFVFFSVNFIFPHLVNAQAVLPVSNPVTVALTPLQDIFTHDAFKYHE